MLPGEAAAVTGQEPSPAPPQRLADPPDDPGEFAAAVRHLAWRKAPKAGLQVDAAQCRLLVRCFPGVPDVEVDEGATLSAGFHSAAGEHLLTSLCLTDVRDWSLDRPDVRTARTLLGRVMVRVAEDLLVRGGRVGVALDRAEADHLVSVWCAFVAGRAQRADH
jgi:hypothetical protein